MFYIRIEHKKSGRYSITFASDKYVNLATHTYNRVTYCSLKRVENLIASWEVTDIHYFSYGIVVHYRPKS